MPYPSEADAAGGFTLIEMLVVLTILGLLAAVAAQRIGSGPGFGRDRAALKLDAAIAAARVEARRTGRAALVRPGDLVEGAELRETVFPSGAALAFHADGSSNGGVVMLAGAPLLRIDWLTGETSRAR